ncbi:uncharacterized protein ACIBXB_014023 [Morphnus guianensis]
MHTVSLLINLNRSVLVVLQPASIVPAQSGRGSSLLRMLHVPRSNSCNNLVLLTGSFLFIRFNNALFMQQSDKAHKGPFTTSRLQRRSPSTVPQTGIPEQQQKAAHGFQAKWRCPVCPCASSSWHRHQMVFYGQQSSRSVSQNLESQEPAQPSAPPTAKPTKMT